jgi:hypothetical protein
VVTIRGSFINRSDPKVLVQHIFIFQTDSKSVFTITTRYAEKQAGHMMMEYIVMTVGFGCRPSGVEQGKADREQGKTEKKGMEAVEASPVGVGCHGEWVWAGHGDR